MAVPAKVLLDTFNKKICLKERVISHWSARCELYVNIMFVCILICTYIYQPLYTYTYVCVHKLLYKFVFLQPLSADLSRLRLAWISLILLHRNIYIYIYILYTAAEN